MVNCSLFISAPSFCQYFLILMTFCHWVCSSETWRPFPPKEEMRARERNRKRKDRAIAQQGFRGSRCNNIKGRKYEKWDPFCLSLPPDKFQNGWQNNICNGGLYRFAVVYLQDQKTSPCWLLWQRFPIELRWMVCCFFIFIFRLKIALSGEEANISQKNNEHFNNVHCVTLFTPVVSPMCSSVRAMLKHNKPESILSLHLATNMKKEGWWRKILASPETCTHVPFSEHFLNMFSSSPFLPTA